VSNKSCYHAALTVYIMSFSPCSSSLNKSSNIALYHLVAAIFIHQPRRVISENHWLRLHADGAAYTAAEQADAHTRYAALMRAVRTYRRSLYDRVGDRALMDVLRELGADEMKMPAIQVGVPWMCGCGVEWVDVVSGWMWNFYAVNLSTNVCFSLQKKCNLTLHDVAMMKTGFV
jgi:hypothetical protein